MLIKSTVFVFALMLGGSALSHAGASVAATHAHGHAEGAQALQLDNGKRWATDAPLRQAMGILNDSMRQSLPGIHAGTLSPAQYLQLAEQVRAQAAYMVEHCTLSPAADAQLHLIIGRLLAGADSMAADPSVQREGALSVLGALGDYASHFSDAGFSPIVH